MFLIPFDCGIQYPAYYCAKSEQKLLVMVKEALICTDAGS
jgi:hypothetical protein